MLARSRVSRPRPQHARPRSQPRVHTVLPILLGSWCMRT